jgi:hypothetical protein
MRKCTLVLALLAFVLPSCSLFQENAVTVKAQAPELRITNTSKETVYYIVYPSHVMAYVTVSPTCTDDNAIKAGETKSVSYESILQTGQDEEAVVYWWKCDEGKKTTGVGNAHLIRVKL